MDYSHISSCINMIFFILFSLSAILSAIGTYLYAKYPLMRDKVREEVKHLSYKNGTPVGAGIIVVFVTVLVSLIDICYLKEYWIMLINLVVGLFIGFYDDLKKSSGGFGRIARLVSYSLMGLAPTIISFMSHGGNIFIPILGIYVNLSYFYIIFGIFVFNSIVNAVNFTDGFNGGLACASTATFLSYVVYFVLSFCSNISLPSIPIMYSPLLTITVVLIGSICGFWYFNNSGKVFIGNCGSTAIGAALGTLCLLTRTELLIPISALMIFIEGVSVLITFISIRGFNRRVFKMAPIHHHFELSGYSTSNVQKIMYTIAIIGLISANFIIVFC